MGGCVILVWCCSWVFYTLPDMEVAVTLVWRDRWVYDTSFEV